MLRRGPVAASPDALGRRTSDGTPLSPLVDVGPGDYVSVRITESLSHNTLRAEPLARCSIGQFASTDEAHWRLGEGRAAAA